MRVLALAIAIGSFLLVAFVYLPAEIRSGTPVRRFKQLPVAVAEDLTSRGCNIVRGHNVISADFTGAGRREWAVLCQQGDMASLHIYAGASRPVIFDRHGAGLGADPESARGIRVVSWDYVAKHNPALRLVSPPFACIEDSAGMGSLIYCYLAGTWTVLPGAD
jgi:hypothetical protein